MGNKKRIEESESRIAELEKEHEELESRIAELEKEHADMGKLAITNARFLHLVYQRLLLLEKNAEDLESFYDKTIEEITKKLERKSQ